MLDTSIESAFTIRSCSSWNVVSTKGLPSVTRLMSQDVPPTSTHIRLFVPIMSPKCALATVPAAGPANTISNGRFIATSDGTSCAAQLA